MEAIARYYDESKNPDGVFLPGVPLADISEEHWDALPEWIQGRAPTHGTRTAKPRRPRARPLAESRATDDQR